MKLKLALIALPAAFAFAGVSTNAQDTIPACEQAAGQAFLGTTATQESGAAIMQATGATTLQWIFEGSPMTRDMRPGRVRVVYNREMEIIAVTCG